MANELKPCPFCGGTDLSSGGDDKFVGYSCKTCQATGPNHYGSRDWNTRPAAPVEGLETNPLNWAHHDGNYPTWRSLAPLFRFEAVIDKSQPLMYGRFPLRINGTMSKDHFDTLEDAQAAANARFKALALECYRSSGLADRVEAIIAAERAEKLKWMEEGFAKQERVWSLEADNAALTARVKELEENQEILLKDVVGDITTFRDTEPEEGETWESWYFAAFDLLIGRVRATFTDNSVEV